MHHDGLHPEICTGGINDEVLFFQMIEVICLWELPVPLPGTEWGFSEEYTPTNNSGVHSRTMIDRSHVLIGY